MTHYATLFDDLLNSALAVTIERVRLAEPLVAETDRAEAWHLLSYALKEPQAWAATSQLLLLLAPKMEQAGFRAEWIAYLQAGVESGTRQHDLAAVAECEFQIALLYRMLSQYEQAVQWLAASRQHFCTLGDKRGQARVLNEWAWVEQLRRRFDDATRYVEAALALLAADDPERGMSYRVQGMIAIYQGRWEEAEAYHRRSLAVFERQREFRKIAWATQNIGFSLRGQEKYQASIECFHRASTIMMDLGDEYHWTSVQNNLGLSYYYSNNPNEAIVCFLNAEVKSAHFHDILQLARINTNLGLAYMLQGSKNQAIQTFQNSIRYYQELGMVSLAINAMDGLATSYIANEQFGDATKVIEDALSLLPQIVNEPNYVYLSQSLHQHWQQAQLAEATIFVADTTIP